MAFDEETAATRARAHITSEGEDNVGYTVPRIMALIPEALNRLGVKVSTSDDREEFQVTLTPGSGLTLAAGVATITDGTVIKNSIPMGGSVTVTASGVKSLAKPLPNYNALFANVVQADCFHYALLGVDIHFKDKSTGAVDVITGTGVSISVTASRIPTLAQLSGRYQQELVDILAKVAREQLKMTNEQLPPVSE